MFGRSKPVVFDRYESRRSRKLIPNWLWLLLFGIAIGAGALFYAQHQLLPPRLSAAEASQLRAAMDTAEQERSRLAAELAQANKQLEDALATQTRMAGELAANHADLGRQREHVEALLAALPSDPRDGIVGIRAARFKVDEDQLGYDMVFTRAQAKGAPFAGVMQLHIAGKTAGGTETTIALDPVAVKVGEYEIAQGSLPMPRGFVPRQASIRILDHPGGKQFGMRVLNVY
jgi:cell division protein FtsB